MMTNLFSCFDPSTSMKMSLNWVSTMMTIMIIPCVYWYMPSRIDILNSKLYSTLYMEFKMILGKNSSGMKLMMLSLFMFILNNNFLGLLPYIFTSTSHLSFSMAMALPLWLSMMMFGWFNKAQEMFSHLIPSGTPALLMPFMVLIETTSNLIRPGSLAVRLMANMISGHLLMSLLGNNMTQATMIISPLIFMTQMFLMMFEMAVSIIQAYVFSMLTTLYSSEVN
uniref:ATP synthase subunit a n=1 Tax=Mystilus priamus TaxID=2813419 RepID=A0A8T9ZYX4_9HEMI|nr:ATPase subunit 6 [Mystilus priamus]